METRYTAEEEYDSILSIHEAAFGIEEGAVIRDLVVNMLEDPTATPSHSIGIYEGRAIIGHVLFTRISLGTGHEDVSAQLLAPLAVHPDYHSRGIGTTLVKWGLDQLSRQGVDVAFVLGHPGYYPRFGFTPAGIRGFAAPYPIPEENADAWMILPLNRSWQPKVEGTVQCCTALNQPQYWRE